MALEKKTIKIIAIVVVVVVVLGLLLGLLLRSDNIELQVWPRGADGSAQPLISYKSGDHSSVQSWVERIDNFLRKYQFRNIDRVPCTDYRPLGENQVCDVPLEDFYPCVPTNQYNYKNAAPCVFLTLDKTLDWTPKPFNSTADLLQTMPENLKRDINKEVGKLEANEVWVSCDGVEPADKEYIGPVKYIPRRGFPTYYFPSSKTIHKPSYLSPLVAVLFEGPHNNVLINVECKAWAKNINTCKNCEPTASARFQLMIN